MVLMKRFLFVILVGLIAGAAFADEELDFYTAQFNNALTATEQLNVLQVVREAEIQDAGTFYASALSRILQTYPVLKDPKQINAADESIRIITDQVTSDQSDMGPSLWRAVQVSSNPLVRSDAIIALGKIGATDLIPQVVQLLKDTNSSPYTNRLSGERLAYGAIVALESYKDASGYLPVFFAANGWYPGWVKTKATEALATITEDPTEPLTQVIQSGGYTYEEKYLALMAEEQSKAEDGSKATVAVAALTEGWKSNPQNSAQGKSLVRMRKLALDMITRYGTDDEKVYALLDRSYRYGADEEEQLGVIGALGKLASDNAVQQLSTYAVMINERLQWETLTQRDERLMRALIPALGASGNTAGKPVLQHVMVLDWNYNIHNIAQDALNNLGK